MLDCAASITRSTLSPSRASVTGCSRVSMARTKAIASAFSGSKGTKGIGIASDGVVTGRPSSKVTCFSWKESLCSASSSKTSMPVSPMITSRCSRIGCTHEANTWASSPDGKVSRVVTMS